MPAAGRTALSVVMLVAALVLVCVLFDILLLTFAAILIAVVVRTPADWLRDRTSLSSGIALALTLTAIVLVVAGIGWLFGAAAAEQARQLAAELPNLIERLHHAIGSSELLPSLAEIDASALLNRSGALLGRGMSAISATFGALANVVLVVFMAVLFAAQPRVYRDGFVQLLPRGRRARIDQVLESTGATLRRWILGQLALMVFVAVLSGLGLWLIGVRYALLLGLLAGLLTFVPFIGPLTAALVAIVVSLADGWQVAAYVALLYLGVQIVEGVLEPLVQQKAVYLPPVLLLLAQIVFGVLVGVLGVIVATPFAAALMVIVRMLYVEDVLGEEAAKSATAWSG